MFKLCKPLGVALVGGDVARGEHFSADVVMVGTAPKGKALLRSGAKPGDAIYVSGRLGGSALGLQRLLGGTGGIRNPAVKRHLNPQPRLELGRFLRERLRVSAAMDLSDGLSMDLGRLALASGVGAEIDTAVVPRFPGASLDQALHGGEDYELLFTAPAGRQVAAEFEGLPLTRIGTVLSGRRVTLLHEKRRRAFRPEGFQHFQMEP
jgi:thiamine-monophosphate kinase